MSADLIVARLAKRLYGSPVVRNDARGELVEEIVALALEPDWQLCSTDWAACDLVHIERKLRMQVKQSAARQSWHKESARSARPCYSIAEKSGRYENGDTWINEKGRNADVFLFAWHPVIDSSADHRNPHQWEFFAVLESALPAQKTIALSRVRHLTNAVSYAGLKARIGALLEQF
jgi:hypothetical protein